MTSDLIMLRGFEQALYDMPDNPKGLHRLMAFLRDENLANLDFLQENALLSLNNGGDFIGTGGYGWSSELPAAGFDGLRVRTQDMWGFCESQETMGVSPKQFEEFVFRLSVTDPRALRAEHLRLLRAAGHPLRHHQTNSQAEEGDRVAVVGSARHGGEDRQELRLQLEGQSGGDRAARHR